MSLTAGIDIGSTYTKAVVLDGDRNVLAKAMRPTGFRLEEASREALDAALAEAGAGSDDVAYVTTTGYGRNMVSWRDLQVTDMTAQSWGTRSLFPATRTVLDVGGQTMKAIRLDGAGKVRSFRLNDKCAAGTGAFLEKTARYLGYRIEDIGPLVEATDDEVPISGVCAVFAESEVINHVSQGESAGAILHGAMRSLIERSVRLMKRVQMEPEFTLVGGIMRFPTMVRVMREHLSEGVNVPPGGEVQFTAALGASILGRIRLEKRGGRRPDAAGSAA